MAKGDRVTSLAFNNVQTAAALTFGIGSGTQGYGQVVTSSTVAPNTVISATQWTNLRNDMAKCYTHQTGNAITDTLPVAGNTASLNPPSLKLVGVGTVISDALLQQYNNFKDYISNATNRDQVVASQVSPGQAPTSTQRTTAWNGTISHTITYTFPGYGILTAANHIRNFFNAGGSIQIYCGATGGTTASSGTKDNVWQQTIGTGNGSTGFGTLTFRAASTSITGGTNGGSVSSATGYRSLAIGSSTSLLVVNGPSGVYSENIFRINVTLLSNGGNNNQLQFTLQFEDNDTGGVQQTPAPGSTPGEPSGPVVDENVTATITTYSSVTAPSGANVAVNAPSGSTTAL
jgi:hypothetical protein